MAAGAPLTALAIAAAAIIVILILAFRSLTSQDFFMDDDSDGWIEPFFNAFIIVSLLGFLSWFNLRLIEEPVSLEMNVTGAFVPVLVSSYLLVHVPVGWNKYSISFIMMAALAYLTTDFNANGVHININHWFLIILACAFISYILAGLNLRKSLALSYVSASLGMLFGGDVMHLYEYQESMGTFIFGFSGLLDFIFLSGILAVAFVGAIHYITNSIGIQPIIEHDA
ncbi:MAG: DUF1614 domain-containing protein [Methanomassiliicoccales archaeon]